MLSSLLAQFRQRFPQGSLTTELLTIHDGQYVVQVCVALEGTPLACALGADPRVEVAEDRATGRALQRLGLESSDDPGAAADRLEVSSDLPIARRPVPPPEKPLPPEKRAAALDGAAVVLAPPLELAVPPAPLPDPKLPDPNPPEPALPAPAPTPLPSPLAEPLALAEDLGQTHGGPVIPIDLSDIIAQTDVELQRLGWDVNQGREFLEKTYGKRSRHDLTDDELLEFLLYLETQSAPSPT